MLCVVTYPCEYIEWNIAGVVDEEDRISMVVVIVGTVVPVIFLIIGGVILAVCLIR